MKLIMSFLFLILVSNTFADDPSTWQSFLIHSKNNQWTAVIDRNTASQNAAQDQWHLSVFNQQLLSIPQPNQSPLWTVPFSATGYQGGTLSDDGEVFAFIDVWYSTDKPLITIYRKDCRYEKPGSAFHFSTDFSKTESHQWLTENSSPRFVSRENKAFVELDTLEGKRFISINCERELPTK